MDGDSKELTEGTVKGVDDGEGKELEEYDMEFGIGEYEFAVDKVLVAEKALSRETFLDAGSSSEDLKDVIGG